MRHDLIPFEDRTPVAIFTLHIRADPTIGGGESTQTVIVGATIRDMVPPNIPDEYFRVSIGGIEVPPEYWDRVRPKAGTEVEIYIVPGGPLVGLVAAAVGSFIAASGITIAGVTLIAGGTFAAAVAGAVISFAILSLGQSLIGQPDRANNRRDKNLDESVFSISGTRNRLAPYDPIPVVLGTHRFVPPYGAQPYTEIAGNDQFLRIIVTWGYATVSVSNVKIGNTLIGSYSDAEQEDDFSGSGGTFTLYPDTVNQENLSITLADNVISDTYSTRNTDPDIDEFGVTVTLPRGLYDIDDQGNATSYTQRIEGEYRIAGSGDPWTQFIVPGSSYSGPSGSGGRFSRSFQKTLRYSWRVTGLTPNEYEVRLRATLQSDPPRGTRDASWTALRSYKNANPIAITGVASSAFRVRASDQLNGVIDQLNGEVSTLVPTWNGSIWTGSNISSNPAAIFRYILTGAPNARAVAAAKIDDAALGDWYDYCETKGFKYEKIINYRASVRDLLTEVSAAGMAAPELIDGKWSVIIDRPKSTVVQHFTPRNSSNFSSQIQYVEVPEGLRVRFNNRDAEYEEDERVVYDDGFNAGNATQFQTLDLPGITDPDNVYQIARHRLAEIRLRPEIFTFEVDMENLVATRGDRVYFSHDVPLIGQTSGRIAGISGNDLTLDEPVVMTTGSTYGIRVRAADGTSYLRTVTTVDGTYFTITVDSVANLAVGDLFSFGETGEETLDVIIKSIEGLDDLAARITCVPYNEAIYTAADSIPTYTSVISSPVAPSFSGPPNPRIQDILSDENALTRTSAGDLQPGILVYALPGTAAQASNSRITRSENLQVRYRVAGTEAQYDSYTYTPLIPVDGSGGGILLTPVEINESYEIGVRAIGPFGESSNWSSTEHTVIGNASAPDPVDSFGMNVIGDHAYLEWTYASPPIDLDRFEVRYSTAQDVTDWNSMTVLATQITRRDRSFTVPAIYGSYGIKPVDAFGTYSTTAKYINASLEDSPTTNNVSSTTENPSFSGTKTNLLVDTGGSLSVDIGGGFFTGTYEFGETDLGGVFSVRLSVSMTVAAENIQSTMSTWTTLAAVANLSGVDTDSDGTSVVLEVAYSLDDVGTGQTYTDWRPFVVGDYTARWVKYRLTLTTDDLTITPVISALTTSVDAPNSTLTGEDITSGATTYSVTFSPAFITLKSVAVTGQDMATGDYFEITNKSRTGFDVVFKNSAGTAVSRTFDYTAVGYGRERGT